MNEAALRRAATLLVALGLLLPAFLTGCDDFTLYDTFYSTDDLNPDTGPLEITPTSVELQVDGNAIFTATGGAGGYAFSVVEPDGGTLNWTSDTAVYTAPAAPGDFTVRVTDAEGDTAQAAVLVIPRQAALTITPAVAAIRVGETKTFVASGGAGGYVFTVEAGPGVIDPESGVYYAGSEPGEAIIVVTDAAAGTAEAAVIVIGNQELFLVPQSVTISVNSSYQFGSVGGVGTKTFSLISGAGTGEMTDGGLYTAPSSPVTAQVQVQDEADNQRLGVVYVVESGPLGISPLNPVIEEGTSISFSGYGGTPPYTFAKSDGPGTFDPVSRVYTADSGDVGPSLATIVITDDDDVTTESHVTVRPAAPGNLVADGTYPGPKTIELTWVDRSAAETAYRVERKQGHSGAYADILTVPLPADTEWYLDDDPALEPNTLYVYRVIAVATDIESFPSNEGADLPNASP